MRQETPEFLITNAVKGIAELVTKSGLVNLDFADIRTIMGKGGVAMIGIGESATEHRALEAVDKAVNNPLLDFDINARSTLNLLECFKKYCPKAKFIYLSTNKVYGDNPNLLPLKELSTRLEISKKHKYFEGIN